MPERPEIRVRVDAETKRAILGFALEERRTLSSAVEVLLLKGLSVINKRDGRSVSDEPIGGTD